MNTQHFQEKLEAEKTKLEGELATLGRKNPRNPADWEATEGDVNLDPAEEGDVADAIDTYETNVALTEDLEKRLSDVRTALDKITQGTYGTCDVCGEKIDTERLEANPAARTCSAHM